MTRIRFKIKDFKNNIKWRFQRFRKGYADYDLYDIDGWFVTIFPKMLEEFAERTCGYPCHEEKLKEEVAKFPKDWKEKQLPAILEKRKEKVSEIDYNNSFNCWLLIILRMKYCFERCDDGHKDYKKYFDNGLYQLIDEEMEKNYIEAFYLLKEWFFNLWW